MEVIIKIEIIGFLNECIHILSFKYIPIVPCCVKCSKANSMKRMLRVNNTMKYTKPIRKNANVAREIREC